MESLLKWLAHITFRESILKNEIDDSSHSKQRRFFQE